MTRCREFYIKFKKNPSFCEDSVVKDVRLHIQFMDEHFPDWLDNDKSFENSKLNEGSSRPIRSLKKTDPDMVEETLEWVCEQEEPPTAAEIKEHIRSMKREKQILVTPEDLYDVIVVDPPWPLTDKDQMKVCDDHRASQRPYDTMSIEDIIDLDIPAAEDCVLWLWTTNINLHNAFHVLEAWGFEHKSVLTWVKDRIGTGYWLRGKTEHCILAVRGSPVWTNTKHSTVVLGPLRQDSRKPDNFYALVNAICTGKRLDMFSREKREGWDQHGDEPDTF